MGSGRFREKAINMFASIKEKKEVRKKIFFSHPFMYIIGVSYVNNSVKHVNNSVK